MTKQTIKEKILSYMEGQKKKSFSMEELAEGLGLQKGSDFKLLVQTAAALEREQLIEFTKKGKIKLPEKGLSVEGIFRANERGFGFVTIDEEEPDVYVSKEHTNYALDGDTVLIEIMQPADPFSERVAEGAVLSVQHRAITQVVGEFTAYDEQETAETGLYGVVHPKDKKLSRLRMNVAAQGIKPVDGSIVIVEVTHYPEKGYAISLEGLVKKVIGHKNDPGMDILSIVVAHGIPTAFPDEVTAAADQVPDSISDKDLVGRRDLRAATIVTIDGEDAKDLDDAVTVRKLDNGNYFLGVHIADVSHYVTEGSEMDEEAYQRGTSVYLTDRVVPMLPQRLSNGICSLNPKVPRLTLSCEMEIDGEGHVVRHEIFSSVIQTTERMTYTAVNEILEEQKPETMQRYHDLVPMFQEMGELHAILEKMRGKRGAISFEDREARVMVDEQGHPQEILLRARGVGERLIESFMLAANETVAQHFASQKLPFIYRIHEQPKEEKMQRFFDFAAMLGILVKGTKSDITPKDLQRVLTQIEGKPEEPVINTMLLRSMQQARYSEENYGHYGLAAEFYTHFTSPIRRYPDLIVHRLIGSYAQDRSQERQSKWAEVLPEIADHSSKMERRAVEAEREVDSMKKAEFMADKIGETYDGMISSVTKFGIFVELPNTIEGLVHINALKQDYFHFVEKHLALVGERTGLTLKIGQRVRIRVEKSDPETREIDFELLEAEELERIEIQRPKRGNRKDRRRSDRSGGAGKKQGNQQGSEHQAKQKQGKNKKKSGGKKPFYKQVAKNKKNKPKTKKKK